MLHRISFSFLPAAPPSIWEFLFPFLPPCCGFERVGAVNARQHHQERWSQQSISGVLVFTKLSTYLSHLVESDHKWNLI